MASSSNIGPPKGGISSVIMEKLTNKKVVSADVLNSFPSPYLKGELPAIKLTNSMYKKGLNIWKFSLIGRLDLNKIKLEEAREQLFYQWKTVGEVKLIPIGKGFFVIKLDNEVDKIRICSGNSWKVADQYLQVRDWEPKFNPENQRTSLAKVWIKFPVLSLEYWTEENLLAMAKAFGRPIQVDNNTLSMEFGFFASVLVEVDFANKVPDRVWVGEDYNESEEGFWQCAEIPKVPKFCSHCKIVGHLVTECRSINKVVANKIENTTVVVETATKKKKRNPKKNKETLSLEEIREANILGGDMSNPVLEEEKSISSDPSIPPGFETHNRFQGFDEEQEVVSPHLATEDTMINISKPTMSEPMSQKSKATGLFPNGMLDSKKKCSRNSTEDTNKISAVKLVDLGSSWGLTFPSSKNARQDMFSHLAKNHKGMTIEEVDESHS